MSSPLGPGHRCLELGAELVMVTIHVACTQAAMLIVLTVMQCNAASTDSIAQNCLKIQTKNG